jgi:hypothetical protein
MHMQAVRIYINHAEQEISIGLMSRLAVSATNLG